MKKSFYLPGLLVVCSLFFSLTASATVPTITTNPNNDTACNGANTMFVIAANDTPSVLPITYMWQVSTDGTTWSTITDTTFYSGTTNDTLTVTASADRDGYLYRCIAFNTDGADTSTGGMLTVQYPAAAITGANAVCMSSSIGLADAVAGGIWSRIYPSIDTVTPAGLVTGLSAGFDTISYTVTNACGVTVATLPIRVDIPVIALPISGPTVTCVGHNITLVNSNTLGTWVWSTSNGSASISHAGILTGLAHGLDTVYYVFTNACNSVTSSYLVQVDTLLNHGVISGASGVCAGSWTVLGETVGGGVWISSNTDVAVVDGSGNLTGVSQGTATISYYLSNGCGASFATYAMSVNREASAIVGIDSVGIGSTRMYMDSAVNGTWSISDTSIATIDDTTGVVTGVDTGTATITYTVTNACGTTTATLLIYVGPPPAVDAIGGPASVCAGANITLTNTTAGGVWASGNDTFATVDPVTGVVHGVATGTVDISYTYTNALGSTTVTKSIFVNHPPIIALTGPAIVAIGGNYFFRATPPGGTFSVSNSSVGTIIAHTDSVVAGVHYASFASYIQLSTGVNHIHYVFTNECGTADSVFTVSLQSVGINNVSAGNAELQIFPNPNQGNFTMNLSSSINEEAVVTITNMVGETVKQLTVSTNKATDIKIDQPAGVYFITANCSGGKYTAKISIAQ